MKKTDSPCFEGLSAFNTPKIVSSLSTDQHRNAVIGRTESSIQKVLATPLKARRFSNIFPCFMSPTGFGIISK